MDWEGILDYVYFLLDTVNTQRCEHVGQHLINRGKNKDNKKQIKCQLLI